MILIIVGIIHPCCYQRRRFHEQSEPFKQKYATCTLSPLCSYLSSLRVDFESIMVIVNCTNEFIEHRQYIQVDYCLNIYRHIVTLFHRPSKAVNVYCWRSRLRCFYQKMERCSKTFEHTSFFLMYQFIQMYSKLTFLILI